MTDDIDYSKMRDITVREYLALRDGPVGGVPSASKLKNEGVLVEPRSYHEEYTPSIVGAFAWVPTVLLGVLVWGLFSLLPVPDYIGAVAILFATLPGTALTGYLVVVPTIRYILDIRRYEKW